ncbi:unnamed protein product [Lathyrus oleraceus]|uniref:Non-specific lipid-transfer protein n=1 Tax=Pisum sativum TaxID=3888 RepID=A0A9D5A381_PEA|nr:non-specific lipid-transfer protein 1-like [Pisum sativum]KAI5391400.1 hypothetical protein KIW84_076269 [Pisum sativum]
MASLKLTCVVALALLCMVVITAPTAVTSTSCIKVSAYLTPCLSYLRGGSGPSKLCCYGAKKLNGTAGTTADRQATCKCLKSAAGFVSGLNDTNAGTLSAKCDLNLPYKFGPDTDCTSITL